MYRPKKKVRDGVWEEKESGEIKIGEGGFSPFYRSPQKVKRAAELRKAMTGAELEMFGLLRRSVLDSPVLRFKSQYIINGYIADFYCSATQLVVEIDGGIHNTPDVIEKDRIRDKAMRDSGFYILRFTNEEVMKNKYKVAYEILRKCLQLPIKKTIHVVDNNKRYIGLKRVRVL